MKKIVSSIFAGALILGLGTAVFAEEIKCQVSDFKDMLTMMQEKHPGVAEKELKEMHKDCVEKMKKETKEDCMVNQ